MATILQVLNNFEALNFWEVAQNTIKENEDSLIVINKQQLTEGINKYGEKIKPKYKSQSYAEMKNRMNNSPGLGTPDLYLTGAFYKSFYIKRIIKGSFEVDSLDDKTFDLEAKYSGIFGLDSLNKEKAIDYFLQSKLVENVKKVVRL